ncbi:MAG: DNA repair exonuclease [Chromatiales bacterium]|jgi:DNA repair protein SbcD/Mre11|nr:DNA repair exonuclease [Chromatiales bacterium]
MRFLHAADLHIDSPLRGLDRYEGAPVERLRTATREALRRLVSAAVDECVDFVILAGDIYDRDWQDFRTGLFFREQMVRLNRAHIQVFMIQGNHDAQGVISKQLRLPDNVKVFPSRRAETVRLDDLAVAVHGRSFPNRAVDEDFVPNYPDAISGYFNIGVLHTSLNGRVGHDPYAPTDVATLATKGYDYWALGHVHARERVSESPRIVFPGNLQGRHARETGAKGCELVSVDAGAIENEFLALDVVRWTLLDIPLDGAERVEELGAAFRAALTPHLAGAADRLHALRVRLSGTTPLQRLESEQPGRMEAEIRAASQDLGDADIWIEQVRLQLRSPIDRTREVQRQDAVGELLRLVDALAADPSRMDAYAKEKLGDLLDYLPAEVLAGEPAPHQDRETLLALVYDAESTVLARLNAAEIDEI